MLSQVRIAIVGGPSSGEFYLNAPDDTVVVGRAPDCQIAIPDRRLSPRHFKLIRDDDICRVIDLGSALGTLVNGQRVGAAILWDGDKIRAGDSVFHVELSAQPLPKSDHGSSPAGEGSPALLETADWQTAAEHPQDAESSTVRPIAIFGAMEPVLADRTLSTLCEGSLLERFLTALKDDGERTLYAIIDGAQAVDLAATAKIMGHEVYTLFTGDLAQQLAHVCPCLVVLDRPLTFLGKWIEALGRNAGVLLQAGSDLHALYAHLRELFVVKDEEGQEYFFRYYDPRVLRTFLPTCTRSELEEFFGCVTGWILEDESASGYEIWSRGRLGLTRRTILP